MCNCLKLSAIPTGWIVNSAYIKVYNLTQQHVDTIQSVIGSKIGNKRIQGK